MDVDSNQPIQDPDSLKAELTRSFTDFEDEFGKKYPSAWWFTLIGPVIITAVLLLIIGFMFGWDKSRNLISHAFITFFILGRLVILIGMDKSSIENAQEFDTYNITLSPLELFGMVTYMDFMVAMFVAVHMGILFKLPYVGSKIAMLVWDGKFLLESQPWIQRLAYWGLVVFVIFPTSTTGSIGGSIFGRLLGLSRIATVSGVLLGSVLGNLIMYVFSSWIDQYLNPGNMWTKVVGVVIIVVLLVLLEMRYHRIKMKYMESKKSAEGAEK